MKTYIIGHIKPDLDSVVSAIALAEYKNTKNQVNTDFIPLIAEPINNETQFVLDYFGIEVPNIITSDTLGDEDEIILVDHNEETQRSAQIASETIHGIYDHHKANLNFDRPIDIFIKTVGSTSTLIWQMMKADRTEPNPKIAGLMLSAVLSDTVGLRSSTTTEDDKSAVTELAQMGGIENIEEWTLNIFKAKSNIADLSPNEIVTNDYKIFEFGDKKVFINQVETVEQDIILKNQTELLRALTAFKQDQGLDFAFNAITDILKVNTKLLFVDQSEKEIAKEAFDGNLLNDNLMDIGAKLSRKKDIAPPIEQVIIK